MGDNSCCTLCMYHTFTLFLFKTFDCRFETASIPSQTTTQKYCVLYILRWTLISGFGLNLEQNPHSWVLDLKDYLGIYKMKFYHIGNLSDRDEYLSICSEIFSRSPDLDSIWNRICIPEFWIQRIISGSTKWNSTILEIWVTEMNIYFDLQWDF